MTNLAQRLAKQIEAGGPISLGDYMAQANGHYYATRDPFGAAGDFITAPEISQMFGELIGLWLADLWVRAGKPPVRYVELGPGRGTLASDALRAMRAAGLDPPIDLVETSPVLRAAQASRLPAAYWYDHVADLPCGSPLLVVANEFFDALPIRQLVADDQGWREMMVSYADGRFAPVPGAIVSPTEIPQAFRNAPPGTIVESAPASCAIISDLASLVADQGGAALIVDYGRERTATGSSLQAVSGHSFADPWVSPGDRDLTTHVDFEALADAARRDALRLYGPISQSGWLRAMGIELRSAALAKAAPDRAEEIGQARDRLIGADQMGSLFKAMALVAKSWPQPEGF